MSIKTWIKAILIILIACFTIMYIQANRFSFPGVSPQHWNELTLWIIGSIIAIVLLIIFWQKNIIWWGLMSGVFLAVIFFVFVFFTRKGIWVSWPIFGKAAVLGIFVGFVGEVLRMIGKKLKSKAGY